MRIHRFHKKGRRRRCWARGLHSKRTRRGLFASSLPLTRRDRRGYRGCMYVGDIKVVGDVLKWTMKPRESVFVLESGVAERKSLCRKCKRMIPVGQKRMVEFAYATHTHVFKRYYHVTCYTMGLQRPQSPTPNRAVLFMLAKPTEPRHRNAQS